MQSQSIHEVKETCITLELSLSYLLQYPTCSTQLPHERLPRTTCWVKTV